MLAGTNKFNGKEGLFLFDERRDIVCPGNREATLQYSIEHFIAIAEKSISHHDSFYVALSGGSTPKAIYEGLSSAPYRDRINWKKVHLFWSDERCVPPYHPDSNYHMAVEAGLAKLHIPPENIHRMQAEGDVEEGALAYESLILAKVPNRSFDLVMLGMGNDGHTASLFPKTHGLNAQNRLAIANYIPKLDVWRLTLTFEGINTATHVAIYVMGKDKATMVNKVLTGPYNPDEYPVQKIGTPEHKALWILDKEAASLLKFF
jgi:6-phosphogluconolactonase